MDAFIINFHHSRKFIQNEHMVICWWKKYKTLRWRLLFDLMLKLNSFQH